MDAQIGNPLTHLVSSRQSFSLDHSGGFPVDHVPRGTGNHWEGPPEVNRMPRRAQPRPDALEPLQSDVLPEDVELAELVKQFPAATRVTIVRYNKASDRWAHLATVPADVFSEDMIQLRWGGGLYQARFRNPRGQIVHTVPAIEIESDPDRPPLAAPDVAPVAPVGNGAAAPVDPNNMFMGMILSELKSNREMMLEMVRGFSDRQPAAQSDLVGMVTALGALQGLLPKPSTPLPEKIVERILEGAINPKSGDGPPQNEWIGLLKDVLVEFKPAINLALRQQLPAAALPPAPAPTAAPAPALPPAEEIEEVDATQTAIDWLKQQHATGAKPEELAPIALHFTDKQQIDLLLAKPNEQIFSEINDEQLGEPGLRAWFESLFEELREIRNIPNSKRPAGDQVNAHENGRTG